MRALQSLAALLSLASISRTIEGVRRLGSLAANLVHDGFADASVGILELGGSSTQVAFEPDDPASATETLSLAGRPVPLFAASHLHCGATDARQDLAEDSCLFPACVHYLVAGAR